MTGRYRQRAHNNRCKTADDILKKVKWKLPLKDLFSLYNCLLIFEKTLEKFLFSSLRIAQPYFTLRLFHLLHFIPCIGASANL